MQTVIHLVSADGTERQTALAIAKNLVDDGGDDLIRIAVIAQGEGINSVLTDGDHEFEVQSLLENGVSFRACRNTLETKGLETADLVDGVEVVPEGAVEVTKLQNEGYAYIRP